MRRTQAGALHSVQSGNVIIGGTVAPYGFDVVTEPDAATGKPRRTLVINEAEAAVVRQVFEMYAGGTALHALCTWLDEHRVPLGGKGRNAGGKGGWSVGTLGRILDNRTYIGEWHYRKRRSVKDPLSGKRRTIPRPQEEWIGVSVSAIVTEELFEAVERRKEANKREMGRQRKRIYAVGGMAVCGHCGKAAVGVATVQGERDYRYYKCAAAHSPNKYGYKCDLPMFRADHVEAAVWRWIKSLLLEPDALRRALENYQQQQRERVQPQLAMLESTQARLGEAEGRKERLIAAYTTGVLTLDELAAQKAALGKEIADLGQAIASLKAETEIQLLPVEHIESIEAAAAEIRAGADEADDDLAAQREIFRLLRVCVTLNYDGEQRWADASCIFDSGSLSVGSYTNCRDGRPNPRPPAGNPRETECDG